jgi:hypothetical protein
LPVTYVHVVVSKKGNTVWRGEIEKGERKRKKVDMRQ